MLRNQEKNISSFPGYCCRHDLWKRDFEWSNAIRRPHLLCSSSNQVGLRGQFLFKTLIFFGKVLLPALWNLSDLNLTQNWSHEKNHKILYYSMELIEYSNRVDQPICQNIRSSTALV
mgnify:CR=1 FL=1